MTGDAVYAGDLQGNLWRLDLTGTTGSYSAPTQIATLTNAGGEAQPMTTRPLVEVDPNSSKRYVMVGTGQLMGESDITSKSAQAFYAIVDGTDAFGGFYTSGTANSTLPSGASFPVTRNALQANTDLLTGIGSKPTSVMGWYFDMPVADNIAQRVNVDSAANRGVVAFIGNLPQGKECAFSGTGTVYAVNFATGQTVLQKSEDVTAPNGDKATVLSLTPSLAPNKGTLTEVSIMRVNGKLRLYAGGSTGDVVHAPANLNTAAGVKQLNWREVPLSD
jgi:type IV pilus assembly protein PilY1